MLENPLLKSGPGLSVSVCASSAALGKVSAASLVCSFIRHFIICHVFTSISGCFTLGSLGQAAFSIIHPKSSPSPHLSLSQPPFPGILGPPRELQHRGFC